MSYASDANTTYVNGQTVDKADVRNLWASVDGIVAASNLGDVLALQTDTEASTAQLVVASIPAAQTHISLSAGQMLRFRCPFANTGPDPIISIGGMEFGIKARNGSTLAAGDLQTGQRYLGYIFWNAPDRKEIRLSESVRMSDISGLAAALSNTGKTFTSRTAAVDFGQSNLPGTLGLIMTVEDGWLAVRSFSNASDDPLFETQPSWGVALRVPNAATLAGALNVASVIPLINIGGTGNAITADLAVNAVAAGASVTASTSVRYIPAATNSNDGETDVTLFVAGDENRIVRSADGARLPAGFFVVGRAYTLDRRGTIWRVATGDATRTELDGKADLANSGAFFTSRAAMVSAGQSALPGSKSLAFHPDGDWLVVRRSSNAADDPLFETQPSWGVALRVPSDAITTALQADLDSKASQTALNDEAQAREAGDAALQIELDSKASQTALNDEAQAREAGDIASRDRANHTGTQEISTVDGLQNAIGGAASGTIRLVNVSGANLITADIAPDLAALGAQIVEGSQVMLTPVAANTGPVEAELGSYPRAVIIGLNGTPLVGGELEPGRDYILRATGGRLVIVAGEVPAARGDADMAWAVGDGEDYSGIYLSMGGNVGMAGLEFGVSDSDWDAVWADEQDYVGFGMRQGRFEAPGLSSEAGVPLDEMDARNRAFSDSVRYRSPVFQLPTATYNIIMNYGQSLAEGSETWPSLSKAPQPGALMIGDNVDNQTEANSYTVIGSFGWQPLVAHTAVGGVNLDGAGEAALSPGDQAKGEPPVIGLTNGLKYQLNRRSMAEDNGKNLVAMSAAVAGKTIAKLSKINPEDGINRYGALIDGITQAKALADSESCCVTMLPFIQGEHDYRPGFGSTNGTRALYRAALHTLFDDLASDIPAITGQTLPPLFMVYQTSGVYARDVDLEGAPGLHVGMAQIDVALERDDTIMFGPAYPYTDKPSGHLDSNGSRWMGHMMAKVAARVMAGEGWQPLRPISVQLSGSSIYVHFHVPVPPLRWVDSYLASEALDLTSKGFRLTSGDGVTAYTITAVEIVRPTIVRIDLAEAPAPDALLWYASRTINSGCGSLADSDPAVAIDRYEYVPDRGMYPEANIPDLVGHRYPLPNWSIAFCIPVDYSEI